MTPFWAGVVVGLFFGAMLGVLLTCLFVAGSWYLDPSWEEADDSDVIGHIDPTTLAGDVGVVAPRPA